MRIQAALLFFVCTAIGRADVIYTLSMDTSALVANSNAPFALDFQLTSGDTTSGVVNSATISQFVFGVGGSAGAGNPFPNSGNASGSLGSTVSLNTSSGIFFNEFSQYFNAGTTLSFKFTVSNNPQPGSTPDEFTFQLIDNSGGAISTTDPSGSNSVFILDLTGGSLQPQVCSVNGDGVLVTPSLASAIPEPGTGVFIAITTLLATAIATRRNRVVGIAPNAKS